MPNPKRELSPASVCRRQRVWVSLGRSCLIRWLGVLVMACCTSFAGGPGEVFQKNCASCHGPDGRAQTLTGRKLGVKDLSKSVLTDMQIEQQILEGRPRGKDTARMPAFKGRLTAGEIESLVTMVKAFRG